MFFIRKSILFDNLLDVVLSIIDADDSVELLLGIFIIEVLDFVKGIHKIETLH